MADKKIEKALYGPSLLEVALGAILGLFAGVLAACVYLVLFKPVMTVKELPKEPVRGVIYYVPGAESNAKGRTWQAKQKSFIAGSNVTLVEEELNAWAASAFAAAPAKPAPGAKAGDKPAAPSGPALDGIFNPGNPNFRIIDGKLQIGTKCILNWYGLTKEVMLVTRGDIVRSGDKFKFSANQLYLGSCPVHLLPAAAGPLMSTLIDKKKAPDDINSAWAKLNDVSIEGNTLKLTVQ
ncbi:MAG TPA: hypothetical protein VG734_21245 [Lacunisphaera sp.]|nr:hypothetical protein [Lacunisphaera sp.]